MALVFIVLAVLLLIVALVLWQFRSSHDSGEVTFGVENAVSYIATRIGNDVHRRLGVDGIRRIVEWEVFYLQGLGQPNRWHPVQTVAGDYGPAVEYIREQIAGSHDFEYSIQDIGSVLALGASYLESIGAIGDEAGGTVE